jgi:hypothetical protein
MCPIDNSDVITRYLLGDVSEEERVWVEAQMVSDEGFIDECFQAEDKIIDDYVMGHLAARERGLFEMNFLCSPRRQTKLQTAKFLVEYARGKAHGQRAAEVRENTFVSIWRAGTGSSRRWSAAAVASVLILGITALTAIVWAIHDYRVAERAQRQLSNQLQQLAKLENTLDALQKNQLHDSEVSANQGMQISGRANKPQIPPIGPVATLMLQPGGFREQEELVKKVVLPLETPLLHLKLMVEPGLKYSRYRVTLQQADGETVIAAANLPMIPTKTAQGEFITVALSSQLLSSGDYILVLAGQPESKKEYQLIASYNFHIQKTR